MKRLALQGSAMAMEAKEIALVGAGAIPGALLRWKLESVGNHWVGGLQVAAESDLIANLLGTFCMGLLVAIRPPRPRLMLFAAIGFCGSLTTFSSWMLELAQAFSQGQGLDAVGVLLVSLVGGLLAFGAGFGLVRLGERASGSGRGGFRQAGPRR
jgi:CrcB protein